MSGKFTPTYSSPPLDHIPPPPYAPYPEVDEKEKKVESVRTWMESAAKKEEVKEELLFNAVTGELEVSSPAGSTKIPPIPLGKCLMTDIARSGFF